MNNVAHNQGNVMTENRITDKPDKQKLRFAGHDVKSPVAKTENKAPSLRQEVKDIERQVATDIHTTREQLHKITEESIKVAGHPMTKADVFKFGGLIAFFAVMIVLVALVWPSIHSLFEEGGLDLVIQEVKNAGPVGVLILLLLQFLQVVVAFIPGEITQLAAGILYGPLWGSLIIAFGCVISSAFVYVLVHKLGAPFVRSLVPEKQMRRFDKFEASGKLNIIVFILFLIPGLPKDIFTYVIPLTSMRLRTFLLLTTIGRIPGIVVSTYAADGIFAGRWTESVILFAVLAAIALVGVIFNEKIVNFFGRYFHRRSHVTEGTSGQSDKPVAQKAETHKSEEKESSHE